MSALALLEIGLLGVVERLIASVRIALHMRAVMQTYEMLRGPVATLPRVVIDTVMRAEMHRAADQVQGRVLRAMRFYLVGRWLGRWWRDPDSRVVAACVLLLGLWVAMK